MTGARVSIDVNHGRPGDLSATLLGPLGGSLDGFLFFNNDNSGSATSAAFTLEGGGQAPSPIAATA